jgi:hypothetical protein
VKLKKNVDFLVVGTAKAGTTSLYEYILQHPDIFLPERKECRYFSLMDGDFNGPGASFQNDIIRDYNEYLNLFVSNKCCGDISNDYFFYYYKSISEIKKRLGNQIPIIIILRNPVYRSFSNYGHHVQKGWEKLSFRNALDQEPIRKAANWAWPFYYKEASLYAKALSAFISEFENVKIYIYEDGLFNNKFFESFFNFIGIDPVVINTKTVYNKSGEIKNTLLHKLIHSKSIFPRIIKSPKVLIPPHSRKHVKQLISNSNIRRLALREKDKEYLSEYFQYDIIETSKILNRDLHEVWF